MTREDIIRMAREAGLHLATDVNWMPIIDLEYAEKFAALVAAAEREAILKLVRLYVSNRNLEEAIQAREHNPMPLFDDWPGGFK